MNLIKAIKDLLRNQRALIGFVVVVALLLIIKSYNSQLGLSLAGFNGASAGSSSNSTSAISAANPAGQNSGPGSANGLQTVTGGVNANLMKQQINNPMDLLPKDNAMDNNWSAVNQRGAGELSNINLLKAGYHAGIDTVGGTLRNANLQVRSEPPNPKTQVSPWLNSTIEPDLMRTPLELGCGSQ